MNNYEKILEIIKKNKGYITTNELTNNKIAKIYLTNMVKKGIIRRIKRGYYGLKSYIEDDFYKIYSKSKSVRFSLNTALYLNNLTDRTPLLYNITLPQGYSGALQKEDNVIITYVKKELLDLGVEEVLSPFGMKIKTYNSERTICDIIKYINKMDAEIFAKALNIYVNSNTKNLNRLIEYSKIMNIEKKVKRIMEVLLY